MHFHFEYKALEEGILTLVSCKCKGDTFVQIVSLFVYLFVCCIYCVCLFAESAHNTNFAARNKQYVCIVVVHM